MKVEEVLLGSDLLLLLLRCARIGPVVLRLSTVCLCWETNSVCRRHTNDHIKLITLMQVKVAKRVTSKG